MLAPVVTIITAVVVSALAANHPIIGTPVAPYILSLSARERAVRTIGALLLPYLATLFTQDSRFIAGNLP
jgi:hypothetical protein